MATNFDKPADKATKDKAVKRTEPAKKPEKELTPSEKEVEAARKQDEREMGKITGVSPFTGLDYRDGIDPVTGAKQGEGN